MKILQCLNHFLPHQVAGTEVYVWSLSKSLQKLGHRVEILIPNYGKKKTEQYDHDGLDVYQFAEPSIVDRKLIMGQKEPEGLEYFRQHLISSKPDVVHFHELAGSNGISLHHIKAAKDLGFQVVFTFHLAGYSCKTGTLVYQGKTLCDGKIRIGACGSCYLQSKGYSGIKNILNPLSQLFYDVAIDPTKWNSRLGTALGTAFIIKKLKDDLLQLATYCESMIVLSKWYERILLLNGLPGDKIKYIPQGLATSVSTFPGGKMKSSKRPLKLMFLGRISPFKGLHLLTEAIKNIPADLVELNIYGQPDGTDYTETLKQQTKDLRNIHWRGNLEREKVIATLQEHHVLCLCSTFSEMSPLVIREAFAAGIPVLAADVYGNAEQITPGRNGWLFKFNNVDDLEIQIKRLIGEPVLFEKLHITPESNPSFDSIASRYLKIYLSGMPVFSHRHILKEQ